MLEIGKIRRRNGFQKTILTPWSYVIDSLKHPDEIERLRSVYGPAFIGIGLYEPPQTRRHRIIDDAAARNLKIPESGEIDNLMRRDEDEGLDYGQRVRDAFESADFILDLSAANDIDLQIWRLVRCLFGDLQITPSIHEYGMSVARVAQAKSGSLARQVGAALIRPDWSLAAVGTNEVAKPDGGQYIETDDTKHPRGRDVSRGQDSSDYYRRKAMVDFIERLKQAGELASRNKKVDASDLFERWWNSQENPWLRQAFQSGTIDYIRAVHAEMAAITDAARNGIDLRGCRMYTTTFPCHDCAKHIVASGIQEVIYLAPYPKSLVAELYDDSVEINSPNPSHTKVHFHSFVGMMPKRYDDFFLIGKRDRKTALGKPIQFDASKAKLTLPAHAPDPKSVLVGETDTAKAFAEKYKKYIERYSKQVKAKQKK